MGCQLPRDTVASLIVRYDGPVYPERRERIKIGGDLLNVTPEQERRTNTEERLRAVGQHGRLITRWRARWTGLRMSSAVRRCSDGYAGRLSYHGCSKEPRAASSLAATSFRVGEMAAGSPDWSSSSTRPRDARTASRRMRVPVRAGVVRGRTLEYGQPILDSGYAIRADGPAALDLIKRARLTQLRDEHAGKPRHLLLGRCKISPPDSSTVCPHEKGRRYRGCKQ